VIARRAKGRTGRKGGEEGVVVDVLNSPFSSSREGDKGYGLQRRR